MLEGLVAWLLNNYLGKYVENLNTAQLSVALLSGEVELENLPLKKSLFVHAGVAVRVRSGFVGKIRLQIPLRQLRSAPWSVLVERLYVVAAPVHPDDWDADFEDDVLHDRKLDRLDALDTARRPLNEDAYYANSFSSWLGFGAGLVQDVLENLQLTISDVHLRYEDAVTADAPFACGLLVHSFSAHSCDADLRRLFTAPHAPCSFKLLELHDVALYWDRTAERFSDLTPDQLASKMSAPVQHCYLLSPVSAVARLKRERCERPLRSRARPRYSCQLSLEEVSLSLTDIQYRQLTACLRGLSAIERIRAFRLNRPRVPVAKNAKLWWTYAVKCHFKDCKFIRPKPTWQNCLLRAEQCIEYVELYSSLLKNPSMTLSAEKKLFKDRIEWDFPFEQLKLLRESAMRRVPTKQTQPDELNSLSGERAHSRSMLMRWFPQWWGWYNTGESQQSTSDSLGSTDADLEGEILDVLADTVENDTVLKRDSVFGLFEFILSKATFTLFSSKSASTDDILSYNSILELGFENVGFSVISRPRSSSHTISVTLGSIYLKDFLTENSLFPILISSHGKIRENLCNLRTNPSHNQILKATPSSTNISQMENSADSLFQLIYEKKPLNMNCDYRLYVKSQSLEIVYSPLCIKRLVDFAISPFSTNTHPATCCVGDEPQLSYFDVKNSTKMHIMNRWENILQGDINDRYSWNIELDISAPQLYLIENFTDHNGLAAVLDFGKFHLSKCHEDKQNELEITEDDDNEMFMTPCSTPPASEVSDLNLTDCGTSPLPIDTPQPPGAVLLNQESLHSRLYDKYKIELRDLQILIGKVKDNWKFSNIKGTSGLHIVDRFNILLEVERRVIYTSDPQFPSVTLCGSLPNLIVHMNENKLFYIQSLITMLNTKSQAPKKNSSHMNYTEGYRIPPPMAEYSEDSSDSEATERTFNQQSKLLLVQFSIEQLALEVQSRGRSIAEIQICGVKSVFTKRLFDVNLSLSVHSFLLVDALQTYGPDFELLVASHKHVGMDFTSGRIRDSEPTSPTSPSSPPENPNVATCLPPPAALSYALSTLNKKNSSALLCTSPLSENMNVPVIGIVDSEALIVVDLTIVSKNCPSHKGEELIIANILFNNLDIIANQETIVELIGFAKRIMSHSDTDSNQSTSPDDGETNDKTVNKTQSVAKNGHNIFCNEITFDFHRLSVLLLRASVEDGSVVGRKIATATMSDAKIQATVSNDNLELTGSLGGLQVVSLCSGTLIHHKILSVGLDPIVNQNTSTKSDFITSLSEEIYMQIRDECQRKREDKAFSFRITKKFNTTPKERTTDNDDLSINICARMASVWYTHSGILISEIQSCASEFKQYLSNLAKSIKTAATDMAIGLVNPPRNDPNTHRMSMHAEWISPRRPRSVSFGFQDCDEIEDFASKINLTIDILLETPVVVLPRSSNSSDVFVAHLGTISINNKSDIGQEYLIEIKDINVYSLDITDHLNKDSCIESLYECSPKGKPVLHDTTMEFRIQNVDNETLQINGKVVTQLKVSATRQQYEQLLDTVDNLSITSPSHSLKNDSTDSSCAKLYSDTTLNMDPQIRAQLFNIMESDKSSNSFQALKVSYQLPIFTIELRGNFGKGEQSLVSLSFRDYVVKYVKSHQYETNLEMSLRSITMEDLGDVEDKYRFMMSSHKLFTPKSDFVSSSTPDLRFCDLSVNSEKATCRMKHRRKSLPHQTFKMNSYIGKQVKLEVPEKKSSFTLPQDNLVLISIRNISHEHPEFRDKYFNVKKLTKINFNSLDLMISMNSWVVVLDFFGVSSDSSQIPKKTEPVTKVVENNRDKSDFGDIETDVSIQSLNIILLRPQYEVCRANISRLEVLIKDNSVDGSRRITGTLGSMSLTDLSPHGHIWKERFSTCGNEALNFQYDRFAVSECKNLNCDTKLSIEMNSVVLIHTKRFVAEIQAFFRDFSQLQSVLTQARQKVSVTANAKFTRMKLSIVSTSPAILIPVSSNSTSLLVAELEKLTVDNDFKISGSPGTISTIKNSIDPVRELLDVMTVKLDNMNIYCGEKYDSGEASQSAFFTRTFNYTDVSCAFYEFGPMTIIKRQGPFLLKDKCELQVQVEKNLEKYHNVPDMSIQGTLNTLDGTLNLAQYKIIKGLLSTNLGEDIFDLGDAPHFSMHEEEKIWTLTSIKFDLLNVILRLEIACDSSSLACINFIKSRLLIETYSDMTQDIDLVSQEILLSDIRYEADPANKRNNVFSNIVIPMRSNAGDKAHHSVQAEIHARKRKEHSSYTIMVNSMRLMAIIDWWQAVNAFIMSPPTGADHSPISRQVSIQNQQHCSSPKIVEESHFDLKVNITDSQIVFVEDTSQWDTNAVILKSTIVITYKPGCEPKPLSCIFNHCEVFSCILGMEDETALSIIDPATFQIDLTSTKVLKIQSPQFCIRLSYHDVCMLLKMFHSLPSQTMQARSDVKVLPANKNRAAVEKLQELGFSMKDCEAALVCTDDNLENAALWLLEHSNNVQNKEYDGAITTESKSFECFQLKTDCISICIIDDCRDSDVPLLEMSLFDVLLVQDMYTVNNDERSASSSKYQIDPNKLQSVSSGKLQCRLTSDYYNRALSGWEPFIEPWNCHASWEYDINQQIKKRKIQVELNSTEMLNVNITGTLIDLYNLVKNNWTQDYYCLSKRNETSPKHSPPGYKRRSPFIPYALKNLTGNKLWFTTIVTTSDIISENIKMPDPDDSWLEVLSEQTVPFKFGERGKQRHRDSHKLKLHQLGVRIEGWNSISPVCVDKVGVFFRHVTHTDSDVEARLVFSISLEGSARKLITVHSALKLVNHLPITIEVHADNITSKNSGAMWSNISSPRPVYVNTGDCWYVPLSHNPTPMWVRPIICSQALSSPTSSLSYLYCAQPLDWRLATRQAPEDCLQIPHVCHSNLAISYRFCCILIREKFPMERGIPQPGHTMILKPPVRIINLLPVELTYRMSQDAETFRIPPGQASPLSQVDVKNPIEILLSLEGFPGVSMLCISPTATESFSSRLRLSDTSGRKLTLNAYISIKRSDTIKVSISVPYWIINRTGIPIVFRQEGIPTETAGQFEEHEIARMVAPLLFTFADSDGSSTVVARVGTGVIHNGTPQWCSPFGLSPGVMVRRLVVGNISAIVGNERVLLVGIAVRPGRGRYRYTNICTISPRFQIHNNTSYHLQFSQKCFATTIADPGAASTYINTTPKCSIPFHWPNHDQELLLCVKIMNIENCNWSGGFQIDNNHSLHINIRDSNAISYFLRLEVILQGATYFIVFTDADTMPPPIRIDNYAHVHLHFHQVGCKEESLIKAHTSKPWALIEPCAAAVVAIRAPGGTRTTINLQKLDETKSLTYQNFIYIAFSGTHSNTGTKGSIEDSQLVLEVATGPSSSGIVFLAKKRDGERAQLWRLNADGHLLHEGSSPPQPANAPPDVNAPHALVLDIEGSAPQPSTMVGLCVRRVHPRRSSTQTWRFTVDGRLRCAHNNMIVQPLDGYFGLREGNRAVLGLPGPAGPHILNNGILIEHAVSSQTLRPGSGSLNVTVTTDGPTRVIKIIDTLQRNDIINDNSEANVDSDSADNEVQVRLAVGGIGLSLVANMPSQELLYCLLSGVLMESIWNSHNQRLNLSIQDIQIDNQLLGTACPVLLHIKNRSNEDYQQGMTLPTMHMSLEKVTSPSTLHYNAHIFKHFIISLRPISVHLEEMLLLKLCLWAGIGVSENIHDKEEVDETDFETQRILTEITAVHAKRYYFGVLKIIPSQIRLSMQTVNKLPPSLAAIKKRLGLKLIKFEDAGVELESFIRWHPFETSQFLWHSILKHYKDELKWQAAIILGSVDFLGNPLGFVQDVSDGVSGLIYEGNVGALVKNVAHGISNSAAKVTESLGDGLGRVILDEAHEETRARIRGTGEGGGANHLVAGLRGLGLGLLGGVTSLVKHTYEGASHQGFPGFFTGVGRGLIGTVTKPVVGVLDLAAETAAAVRDTSRRSDKWAPERSRPPRCPMGPGGLLPRYSLTQSIGHQYLYTINGRDYGEGFLAYDCIRGQSSDIRALISNRYFRVFTCISGEPHIVIEAHLSNVIGCQAIANELNENFIELMLKVDGTTGLGIRRPQVQCDTSDLAEWVSHQLNYAKCMFYENIFTLELMPID